MPGRVAVVDVDPQAADRAAVGGAAALPHVQSRATGSAVQPHIALARVVIDALHDGVEVAHGHVVSAERARLPVANRQVRVAVQVLAVPVHVPLDHTVVGLCGFRWPTFEVSGERAAGSTSPRARPSPCRFWRGWRRGRGVPAAEI